MPRLSASCSDHVALCRQLPKAELHAHLHGSVRTETLLEMLTAARGGDAVGAAASLATAKADLSLSSCFSLFDLMYEAIIGLDDVRRITREAIADFEIDNVTYLELRTTPRRDLAACSDTPPAMRVCTAEDASTSGPFEAYIDAILSEVAAHANVDAPAVNGCPSRCTVRILLSINRTRGVTEAELTVDAAIAASRWVYTVEGGGDGRSLGPFVVGVDVSGDPNRGDVRQLLPTLQRARDAGLYVSVHAAEVASDSETDAIIAWGPDRLGHAVCLCDAALQSLLCRTPRRIPIELCPTSNAITLSLETLRDHPTLATWLASGYPVAICTDDVGVFGATLSEELAAAAHAANLSADATVALALAAFNYTFADRCTAARVKAAATATAAAAMAAARP